jgi:cyclophilin family peptidyl-prolyl cis-trans isomerase/HEAT repeat protein
MRSSPDRLAIAALAVVLAGCPHAPVTPTSSNPPARSADTATTRADDPRIEKRAKILRAADRRVVDDDLRALIRDADPTIRAKAVLALGQIGHASTLADIEPATSDPAAAVRAVAAFSLGLLAVPSSNATAVALAADPDASVRAAAVEALGRLHDPASLPAIRASLTDGDATVRAAAALASWKFADPDSLLDPLTASLQADDAKVRAAAAYALARLTSAAVAPPSSGAAVGTLSEARRTVARGALASRVVDTDPEVRMHVARGLAAPQGPAELAAVGALSGDKDARVRVSAVRSLGFPGVPIMPYLDRATTDRDIAVARTAIESLGKVGGAMAAEKLNTIVLKLSGSWLREAALSSLIQVDPAKAPSVISGLLMNEDPFMRASTAAILVGKKESWAIRAIQALIGDPQPRVVVAAIPLVAEMDGPIGTLLDAFFTSPDPVIRAACADAVGSRFTTPRPGVESRADLYARLDTIWGASDQDSLPDAKLSVLDAAAKGGRDDATRAALDRGLADRDVLVRRRAALRFQDVYAEDRSAAVGPYSDRPLADYVAIARWAQSPHAAIITMQRTGTLPGRFAVALDADAAPMAAWNFATLAGKNFFDGLKIHRLVPNFVVQDGDPRGDGYGGPGYSIRDEFNPLAYSAGTIGMASDGKDTAGSQWFITLSPQPHLDGRYTSFGHVSQGFRQIVTQILPADVVVSIRVYDGDGSEPLPDE